MQIGFRNPISTDASIARLVGHDLFGLRTPEHLQGIEVSDLMCLDTVDDSARPILEHLTNIMEFEGARWNYDPYRLVSRRLSNCANFFLAWTSEKRVQSIARQIVNEAYNILASAQRVTTNSCNAALISYQLGVPVMLVAASGSVEAVRFAAAAMDDRRARLASSAEAAEQILTELVPRV